MARATTHNQALADKIATTRAAEKEAIREAKIRHEAMIVAETAMVREEVLEAVREAVFAGMSTRQIGFAYGSSDPHTAKRIVEEAMANFENAAVESNSGWKITVPADDNALFTIKVYSFGDSKQDGEVLVSLDEDEVNFTAQDGDFWIVPQAYRSGVVENIIKDYWKERSKRDGF